MVWLVDVADSKLSYRRAVNGRQRNRVVYVENAGVHLMGKESDVCLKCEDLE